MGQFGRAQTAETAPVDPNSHGYDLEGAREPSHVWGIASNRFTDRDHNPYEDFRDVGRDRFEAFDANPVRVVEEQPVSTFSADVDTASYAFMRARLNEGVLPPAAAVRVEELINYFPYDYVAPKNLDTPFKTNVSIMPTPWNADTKLMRIGIKGYAPAAEERPRPISSSSSIRPDRCKQRTSCRFCVTPFAFC